MQGSSPGQCDLVNKGQKKIVTRMPVPTCLQKREETKALVFSHTDLMKRLTVYIWANAQNES